MTLLTGASGIANHPFVHALGWTLLHFCWQGAAAALLLWCALGLLEGCSARMRYAAALCALGLIVAAPLATFAHIAAQEYRLRALLNGPIIDIDSAFTVQAGPGDAVMSWSVRMGLAFDHAMPWLLAAWFIGVALFVARLNLGFVIARKLRLVSTQPVPAEMLELFDHLRERLGVRRAVNLMQSAVVQVPTVIGWLRPVVLVPVSCLTGLSELQIEAIFAHELAHIRRHDYLVSVAQSVVEAVLFYHPAVWWVSKQVRRERECCCDDVAVHVSGDVLAYARALSSLEESRAGLPAMVLGANGGVLTMRIKRLLGLKDSSTGSRGAAIGLLAGFVVAAGLYVSSAARAERPTNATTVTIREASDNSPSAGVTKAGDPAQAMQKTVAQNVHGTSTLPAVYQLWLDQDVAWIIAPDERTAFMALSNDQERDAFVNQFWARRNPAGAAENSFKSEHYARIAYSNQHFAAAMPGWKTDRGHVYIVYGKPQSIDSHPTGGQYHGVQAGLPFEVWHYASLPGMGQNVDLLFAADRTGNYRLMTKLGAQATNTPFPTNPADANTELAAYRERVYAAVRENWTAPAGLQGHDVRSEITFSILHDGTIGSMAPPSWEAKDKADHDPLDRAAWSSITRAGHFPPLPATYPEQKLELRLTFNPNGLEQGKSGSAPLAAPLARGLGSKPVIQPAIYKPVAGQASIADGTITGVVTDQTGAVLSHAPVVFMVDGANLSVRFVQFTDGTGRYSTRDLPPGKYHVEAEVRGFKRVAQDNVQVAAGEPVGLNLKLSVGAVSQTLNVNGASVTSAPQLKTDSGPLRISSGVMAENLVSRPNPLYPPIARAAHVQGSVVLHAIISKSGTVEELTVISGPPMLVASAETAVRQWIYKPYLLNGQPTEVDTTITVNFTFGDSAPPANAPQANASGGPPRISSGVMAGNLISHIDPIYPADAKAAGIQGTVILRAVISKEGRVQDLKVVTGPKELIDSAIDAVKQWVYKPYLLNGEPTEVQTTITVNYTFEETEVPGAASPDQAGTEPKRIGGGVSAPLLIYQVEPEFSEQAKKEKVSGNELVNLWVDEQGVPSHVRVLRGVGHGLDEKAIEAVQHYRFKPAMEDGKPVTVSLNVEVNFQFF
jgi:TonB family protein